METYVVTLVNYEVTWNGEFIPDDYQTVEVLALSEKDAEEKVNCLIENDPKYRFLYDNGYMIAFIESYDEYMIREEQI